MASAHIFTRDELEAATKQKLRCSRCDANFGGFGFVVGAECHSPEKCPILAVIQRKP